MESGAWSWLEIVKLMSSSLTPIFLAVMGIYVHRKTKQFEHIQWRGQKLIEKRLSIYDSLASEFNDILCYYTYVGQWKSFTPADIIKKKRSIDKQIYLASPLFSKDFFGVCMNFQNLCFETYGGWGTDARLKTSCKHREDAMGVGWQAAWNELYSNKPTDPEKIKAAYREIMNVFSRDIGVNQDFFVPTTGRVPGNIR